MKLPFPKSVTVLIAFIATTLVVAGWLTLIRSYIAQGPTPIPFPSPQASLSETERSSENQEAIAQTTEVAPDKTVPSPRLKKTASVITETDLWNALTNYRASHQRNSLVSEEPLCVYARKRVGEHQERFKTLSESDSPLDGHAGFQRDADSGELFSSTGFSSVAEVLAFLPDAQTATQVIEWGWDTSAPHREGLLSNEFTHACVVGTAPFYVGILAAR